MEGTVHWYHRFRVPICSVFIKIIILSTILFTLNIRIIFFQLIKVMSQRKTIEIWNWIKRTKIVHANILSLFSPYFSDIIRGLSFFLEHFYNFFKLFFSPSLYLSGEIPAFSFSIFKINNRRMWVTKFWDEIFHHWTVLFFLRSRPS